MSTQATHSPMFATHSCAVACCSGNTVGGNDNPAAQYTPEQVQASGWLQNQLNQVDFILATSGPMADLRASLGHPQPYNMSMLALGNEVGLPPPVLCPWIRNELDPLETVGTERLPCSIKIYTHRGCS